MNSDRQDVFWHPNLPPFFPCPGERGRELRARARKAGAEVSRLLSSPAFFGKILAHLPGTIYLKTDGGDLFWVSTASLPMHRRCLQISCLPPSHLLRPGQGFQRRDSDLCIGNSFSIDLSSYAEWTPAPAFPKKPRSLAGVRQCCRRLNGFLTCLDSPEGLGRVLPLIFAPAGGEEALSLPSASISGQMLRPLVAILRACRRRDLNAILKEGREMVGLGPGLTPSGDDFLGGLLFSIFSLESAYPGIFPWNQEAVMDFIGRAKSRTHPISHAFLGDFASGHAPAPWHELMNALIQECSFEQALSAAGPCLRFGHSSGWDVLAGLLTGMLMV